MRERMSTVVNSRVSSVPARPRAVHALCHTWAATAANVDALLPWAPALVLPLSISTWLLDTPRMAVVNGALSFSCDDAPAPRRATEYSVCSKRTAGGERARSGVRSRSRGTGAAAWCPRRLPSRRRPRCWAMWCVAVPRHTAPHRKNITCKTTRAPACPPAEGTSSRLSSSDGREVAHVAEGAGRAGRDEEHPAAGAVDVHARSAVRHEPASEG